MKLASIGGLTLLLAAVGCRDVSTDISRRTARDDAPMFGAATNQTTVFHFVANGAFASVFWNSNTQSGFINISTADTSGTFYQVTTFDPCCSFATGFGPASELTGDNRKLVFNTNTCTNPDFITVEGPCGVISVEFDKTNFFSGRGQGTSSQTFGNFTFKSVGVSEFSSADATGTVVGFPITSVNFGQMGTNRGTQISISRD